LILKFNATSAFTALYEMTPEEYAEFCKEYNEWLDKQEEGYEPEKEYA